MSCNKVSLPVTRVTNQDNFLNTYLSRSLGTSSGPVAEQKYWWEFIMEGLQVRDMVESVPWSMP